MSCCPACHCADNQHYLILGVRTVGCYGCDGLVEIPPQPGVIPASIEQAVLPQSMLIALCEAAGLDPTKCSRWVATPQCITFTMMAVDIEGKHMTVRRGEQWDVVTFEVSRPVRP